MYNCFATIKIEKELYKQNKIKLNYVKYTDTLIIIAIYLINDKH